jgi:hypothetical protein
MKVDHVPSGFPHAGFPYVDSLKGTPSRKIGLINPYHTKEQFPHFVFQNHRSG